MARKPGSGQNRNEDQPLDDLYKELILQDVAAGVSYYDAWDKHINIIPSNIKKTYFNTKVYGGGKQNGPGICIRNWLRVPKNAKRFNFLRETFINANLTKAAATYQQKRALLAETMFDEDVDINIRLKAIETDNKMAGDEAPSKTEQTVSHNISQDLLDKIRERKK